jgi:hypothetical protein
VDPAVSTQRAESASRSQRAQMQCLPWTGWTVSPAIVGL